MTKEQYKSTRVNVLQVSLRSLAKTLGVSVTRINQMELGRSKITREAEMAMQYLVLQKAEED